MRSLFPVTDLTTSTPGDEGRAGRPTGREDREPGRAGHEDREWSLDELAEAYAYPTGLSAEGPRSAWLRANMVSTLDGAAQHDGRSQPISCAADMRIFGTLRALADVVIAGAQTVRQEG
ncbi:pyrimidine reductase family protein, partial [Streptomyces sp. SID4944]|nr:pyrimidine reductase family protein [Streptomyces sp. SID4944]